MSQRSTTAAFLRRRSTLVWFALVAATILSWWLGTHDFTDDPRIVGVTVIAIGFVKARYVALDFMELRDAPLALRLVMTAWLIVAFAVIATLFFMAGR